MPDEEQFFKHPFKSPFCSDNMEMICVKFKLVEFDSNKPKENIDMLAVVIVLIAVIVVVISVLLVARGEVLEIVSVGSVGMLVVISVVVETTVVDKVELAHLSSGIIFVWFEIDK